MRKPEVLIIGGGLAGLCCARTLHENGVSFLLLEAGERVGGRVKTDQVEGFLLDRGFQVLLSAYPEARAVLDYAQLELKPFYPGSLIRLEDRFVKVADPFRHPLDGLKTLFSAVGSLSDKLRVAKLRRDVLSLPEDAVFRRPEQTTREYLAAYGFSENMIERFFQPFFGGVFLESELHTSSRMFEFIFRMFSLGDTVLPAAGMETIPRQLAAALPAGSIRLRARVSSLSGTRVVLAGAEALEAPAVVLATSGIPGINSSYRLPEPGYRQATYLYFAAEKAPLEEPILLLNGSGKGFINNLCVPNRVAPGYASAGVDLISVTVLGNPELDDRQLETAVREELAGWFPDARVPNWRHLRTYRIAYALPDQKLPTIFPHEQAISLAPGVFACGDHLYNGSIHGAMLSGRHAAEMVLEALGR